MSAADAERAREELGLRSLLDLRNDLEIDGSGMGLLAEAGLARSHLPLSSRRGTAIVDGTQAAAASSDRSPATLAENYLATLEASSDLIVDAVHALATADALPAVFFCAAGKDRTGILSAVVLGAVGVRDEDIVEDYVLTADAIAAIIGRLGAIPGSPNMYRNLPPEHFAPYAETMELVVEGVRGTYGSFAGYLAEKAGGAQVIERLEDALLTDA
jgi:hypothetical protein